MPQKWVNTIPFGSGHTLGTLNHGLESLFYCFITLFGLKSSLVPPGAPWRLPGPPGAPLTPGMSSWPIVCHPGSLSNFFGPGYWTCIFHLLVGFFLISTKRCRSRSKTCVVNTYVKTRLSCKGDPLLRGLCIGWCPGYRHCQQTKTYQYVYY